MAKETIGQPAPNLQEQQKILLKRIGHLDLLLGQIKDEIAAITE